jgi:hypothetical protein
MLATCTALRSRWKIIILTFVNELANSQHPISAHFREVTTEK